jgi:hypothetical protein
MSDAYFDADDGARVHRRGAGHRKADRDKADRDAARDHDGRSVNGRRARGRDRCLPRSPRRRGPRGRNSQSGPPR